MEARAVPMLGCLGPQGPARFNLNFPSRSIFSLSVFPCKEGPEAECTFNKGESSGLLWPLPSARVTPCPEETKEGAIPSVVTPGGPLCSPRGPSSQDLKPLRLVSIKQNLEMVFSFGRRLLMEFTF